MSCSLSPTPFLLAAEKACSLDGTSIWDTLPPEYQFLLAVFGNAKCADVEDIERDYSHLTNEEVDRQLKIWSAMLEAARPEEYIDPPECPCSTREAALMRSLGIACPFPGYEVVSRAGMIQTYGERLAAGYHLYRKDDLDAGDIDGSGSLLSVMGAARKKQGEFWGELWEPDDVEEDLLEELKAEKWCLFVARSDPSRRGEVNHDLDSDRPGAA